MPPPAIYSAGRSTAHRGAHINENRENSHHPHTQATIQTNAPTLEGILPRFLICAATGPDHLLRLHEIVITDSLNDQQFFQQLNDLKRRRKDMLRPWTWLIGVVAINYVTFELLDYGHVSLLRRPGYAPPSRNGDYYPCKEQNDMSGFRRYTLGSCFHPFPSDVLLHYYRNPTSAGVGRYYMDRLTRKLNGPLGSSESSRTAHGLELEPEILWRRVLGTGAVLFICCVLMGTIWSRIFEDASAGFTIASCLMVIEVFMLSTAVQSFQRLQPVYPTNTG